MVKQVLIADRHKAEERRGAFPKQGDGVLVRVVPAIDANIYTAFGSGLLGTCIKCLPQNDCSVVKIEPNLLLKEGFVGTFANAWLSIRYKDHYKEEQSNFLHNPKSGVLQRRARNSKIKNMGAVLSKIHTYFSSNANNTNNLKYSIMYCV